MRIGSRANSTADVQSAQRRDRKARVQMMDDGAGEADADVDVAMPDPLRHAEAAGGRDVVNVGEAFGAQERIEHVKWREARGVGLLQADRGRFRRSFLGERSPSAKDGRRRDQ